MRVHQFTYTTTNHTQQGTWPYMGMLLNSARRPFFLTNEIKERANVLSLYFEKINLMAI